jgi:hypothetical protein
MCAIVRRIVRPFISWSETPAPTVAGYLQNVAKRTAARILRRIESIEAKQPSSDKAGNHDKLHDDAGAAGVPLANENAVTKRNPAPARTGIATIKPFSPELRCRS